MKATQREVPCASASGDVAWAMDPHLVMVAIGQVDAEIWAAAAIGTHLFNIVYEQHSPF